MFPWRANVRKAGGMQRDTTHELQRLLKGNKKLASDAEERGKANAGTHKSRVTLSHLGPGK